MTRDWLTFVHFTMCRPTRMRHRALSSVIWSVGFWALGPGKLCPSCRAIGPSQSYTISPPLPVAEVDLSTYSTEHSHSLKIAFTIVSAWCTDVHYSEPPFLPFLPAFVFLRFYWRQGWWWWWWRRRPWLGRGWNETTVFTRMRSCSHNELSMPICNGRLVFTFLTNISLWQWSPRKLSPTVFTHGHWSCSFTFEQAVRAAYLVRQSMQKQDIELLGNAPWPCLLNAQIH